MRRVVITGMGIVSSIGNNTQEVLASLHEAKSGITRADKYAELGFRSQVQGAPTLDPAGVIDRRAMRFLGEGAAWNHVAMEQAIQDSGLEASDVSNARTGIVMGSGGPSARAIVEAANITREKGPKRVGPFAVPKAMSSTASATLATWFKIKGVNYSISSACATSNHCIGNAAELIQWGKQDMVFAGGSEELHWTLSNMFDAMGAMSTKYNDTPQTASRAYDKDRDGFVIAGGAGVLVLEELDHAKARGAKIYAELAGYGATSDGYDMVAPSGEGAARCMRMALSTVQCPVDYINPHATSTPIGDLKEIEAIREIGRASCPPISTISIPLSPTYRSFASAATGWRFPACCRIRSGSAAPTRPWYSSGSMPDFAPAPGASERTRTPISDRTIRNSRLRRRALSGSRPRQQAGACGSRKEHGGVWPI